MRNKNETVLAGFILVALLLIVPIQPVKAQVVLSGSGYPDGYGQGIEVIYLYENSTGSWVAILDPAFLIFPADNDKTNIEMNYSANTAIKLLVGCNINHTLLSLSTHQEALDIMRTNLTMTYLGVNVFSKNNLTWDGGTVWNDTASTWQFFYEIVINVLIEVGFIYEILITYEIYGV